MGVNVPERGDEEGIQVIPNPFNGTATVNVNSSVTEFVRMQLTDISGKACAKYSGKLQAGGNLFTISAPVPNTYILSIQTSRGMNSVKMVNTGYGNAGKITPNGFHESSKTLKSKGSSYSPFDIGDTLRYHCYFNAFGHVRKSLDIIHYSGILWPTPNDTLHFTFVMEGIPCPAQPIVFDADSNSYNTVLIGNQCWMRENLKTTHYSNGTPIMYGSELSEDNALWYYPCEEVNDSTYGLLYNWKAVMAAGVQQPAWVCTPAQLCPSGWHIPSDEEWQELLEYVGNQSLYVLDGNSSHIAKALAADYLWLQSDMPSAVGEQTDSNNETDFAAVPAGRYASNYSTCGILANFWSSTEQDNSLAFVRSLGYNRADVIRITSYKFDGLSVRCLKDSVTEIDTTLQEPEITTDSTVSQITSISARCGGTIVSDGGSPIILCGICWNIDSLPTIEDNYTTVNAEEVNFADSVSFTVLLTGLSESTTYHIRAFAVNCVDSTYGEEFTFTTATDGQPCPKAQTQTDLNGITYVTLTDIDDNTYQTVQLGDQCWMKENLRTTHYADGTPLDVDSTNQYSYQTAYYYIPNNDTNIVSIYGLLYNWAAVMGSTNVNTSDNSLQGICPDGWHLPDDVEWHRLIQYVSSKSACLCNNDQQAIAKAMASTTGWQTSTDSCTVGWSPELNNATGFEALPAGYFNSYYGAFGQSTKFWSASPTGVHNAWALSLDFDEKYVERKNLDKYFGLSVRCVKDAE